MRRAGEKFIGIQSPSQALGRGTQAGMVSSAVFLSAVALWMVWVAGSLIVASLGLAILAVVIVYFCLDRKLTVPKANLLALLGHLCALFSFYYCYTRLVNVTYVTDSIAGTYMGIVKVLQFQNPYLFSIKPVLDQLGFPPSLYTPRVDGSFEFHLNYPAMNFLALIPSYLAGLHDIRDSVFLFHVASALLIFGAVPPRLKALSLAPFALGFPFAIGYSWTDSVWAFFVLLTAVLWNRDKRISLLSFGLAVATKQIALVAAPFLLIRLLKDSRESKVKAILKGTLIGVAGFTIPNTPFIIASPSSWWAATVAPYLPTRIGLVPGGIGLSEILLDSGLGLSAVVFAIITGLAIIVCVGFFILRYKDLNRFLWAMPVIILFFYPRSLPNYLVFWAFPYLFEWFKYGKPSTSLRIFSLTASAFKATGQNMLGVLRRRIGPLIMLALVLVAVVMGASGTYVAQVSRPKLDLRVDGIADPDSLGVATGLKISVVNYGSESVSPRFFVKWFFLWDVWKSNSTNTVTPASTVKYELTATDALAAIPRGSSFRVAAYDSVSGEFLGLSASHVSNVGRPQITNPNFRWWTLDMGTGRQIPFSWKASLTNVGRGDGGIVPADSTGASGVELSLNSTNREAVGELALSQRIMFNQTNLTVQLYVPPSMSSMNGVIFGLKATDHIHSLYYVLSTTASGRTVSNFDSNTTVTVPVQDSVLQPVFLDLQSSWLNQGWKPSALEVSFFLRSNQPGWFYVDIQQVTS